jgi:hypothetical protein
MKRPLVLLLTLVVSGCLNSPADLPETESLDQTLSKSRRAAGARGISVMTQNLYLGADLNPILSAQDPTTIPGLVREAWESILASDFTARAGAVADLVAAEQPHLIGLQEVALYRIQSPGDVLVGGVPAADVALDFQQLLMDALEARGLDYGVVSSQDEIDVELPMFVGIGPTGPMLDDLRFTDRDVILAREDVEIAGPMGANFAAAIPVSVGGTSVEIRRGWTSAVARVGRTRLRFVNTHLEVQAFAPIQVLQTTELLSILDGETLPVLLVGDLNSAANTFQTPTYSMVTGSGFLDTWGEARPRRAGLTCCQEADLLNDESQLDQRLDLVLARGFKVRNARLVGRAQIETIGEEQGDRTDSGLWPSDHAGVAATLRVPPVR